MNKNLRGGRNGEEGEGKETRREKGKRDERREEKAAAEEELEKQRSE